MAGVEALKTNLRGMLKGALKEKDPDNPIYRAQENFELKKVVIENDAQKVMVDQLNAIERRLTNIESLERNRYSRESSSYQSDTRTTLDFLRDPLGLNSLNNTLATFKNLGKGLKIYPSDEVES